MICKIFSTLMRLNCLHHSRTYSKLIDANNTYGDSKEYIRILVTILPLTKKRDHETPEIWSPIFVVHLKKYLKRIQESFLRMDIL